MNIMQTNLVTLVNEIYSLYILDIAMMTRADFQNSTPRFFNRKFAHCIYLSKFLFHDKIWLME